MACFDNQESEPAKSLEARVALGANHKEALMKLRTKWGARVSFDGEVLTKAQAVHKFALNFELEFSDVEYGFE